MKHVLILTLLTSLIAVPASADEAASPPQNGNSAFVVNLFSKMTPEQYSDYSQIFEQLMNAPAPVESYPWQSGNAAGKITSAALFTTQAGTRCRPFSESYALGGETQTFRGVACQRPEGSWCKLRPGVTYNCALEDRDGVSGFLDNSTVNVNRWSTQMNRMKYKIQSLF